MSEGYGDFAAICIAGGPASETRPSEFCPPCGVCRQVMVEFCRPDFKIILAKDAIDFEIYTLEEMLPFAFSL